MSDKVYVPNTFPTPNDLIDMVMPVVSDPAFRIVMLITRHTLGWGGHNAGMAWQVGIGGAFGLRKLTGLSHQGIINGVRDLLKLGLILVKKGPRNSRTPNQYALNLDLTTGQLVKNLDQSTTLTSPTSQRFRPVLVNNVYSLKIKHNKDKHTKSGAEAPSRLSVVNSSPEEIRNKPTRRPPDPAEPEAFTRWYETYPRHEARDDALKAWRQRNPNGALDESIMTATAAYVAATVDTERRYIKLPATWLRSGCWKDELEKPEPATKRTFVNG